LYVCGGQEYINQELELREELNKSHDQVVNLNHVVAERSCEVEKLSRDIDSLKQENEVRSNIKFCPFIIL